METALQTTMQLIALSWDKRLPPTHAKLQAMLFYLQGWSKVLYGEWYFSDTMETAEDGPFVRTVLDEYGYFGRRPIALDYPIAKTDDLLIHVVVKVYGAKNEGELQQQAKEDAQHFALEDRQQMATFFADPALMKTAVHAEFIDLFRAKKYNIIHWQPPAPTPGDIVEFENSHWLIQPALA
jgi:hypothetical protein